MDNGKISVAIVGGGETGTPMLRQFLDLDFVDVTGVSDLDANAPGMQLAQQHGIVATANFMDLVTNNSGLDIVIDATGVDDVRQGLRTHLEKTKNSHTVVVSQVIARLLMSMAQGHLVDLKHDHHGY